jgi:coenzyme F420-reducing hydrogenase beta subunit
MSLGVMVDRLVRKPWSDEDVDKYVGQFRDTSLSHARQEQIRNGAASGGVTSALFIHGLNHGWFEGVVVCRSVIERGKVRARFEIATSEEAILACRGSKYVETAFLREVLPLIRAFPARVAVVGLPCDISALARRADKEPELARKLALTVALVCGHNSRKGLIDAVTARMEREAGARLAAYKFRVGHWRGQIEAHFDNETVAHYPTSRFNDYQNLFFFCEKKCLACHDHYGYEADLSIGDVWLFRLKTDPIKHSGVIVRSERGDALFRAATRNGEVISQPLDIRDIMDGQSRIGPSHYNVSARARVAPRFGVKLKDTVHEPVRWHQWLNAWLTFMNMKISESPRGQRVLFHMPRRLVKAYLYFKKGLETLR